MVTGEMSEPVTGQLATRHHVIVPDLRGHGQRRGTSAAAYGCPARTRPITAARPSGHRLDRRARLPAGRCHHAATGPLPPQAMRPPRARLAGLRVPPSAARGGRQADTPITDLILLFCRIECVLPMHLYTQLGHDHSMQASGADASGQRPDPTLRRSYRASWVGEP
jgi:hypothetical protein